MRIPALIAVLLSFAWTTPVAASTPLSTMTTAASAMTSTMTSTVTSTAATLRPLALDGALLLEVAGLIDTLGRPATALTSVPSLPLLEAMASAAPTVPAHYAWIERDTRAFWYAAGSGAVTTLAVHILGGIPTLAIGGNFVGGLISAGMPGAVAVALGLFITYTAAEAAISALVSTLVFNTMSTTYQADYLSGFLGHFAGGIAATAVTTLTFGGGLLLLHGAGVLTEFTGGAGIGSLQIFSFLGAMPAVVIAGTALVAVPAIATAWALAAGAAPKPGYAIDEDWQRPSIESRVDDPARARSLGTVAVAMPIAVPLPGT